jgi:hypothetical protein
MARVPGNSRPDRYRSRRYCQTFSMAFGSGEQSGWWTRVMFGGTRGSFAVCQPVLSISIAACVPGGNCEATSSSSRFIATTETCVSTSAAPVSHAGQTAPKR